MKLYILLISFLTFMAFSMGYFTLSLKDNVNITVNPEEIKILKKEIAASLEPMLFINFKDLYSKRGQYQLINPTYTLARMNNKDWPFVYGDIKGCEESFFSTKSRLNKEDLWEEFRCAKRSQLPDNFFINPPYMHSNGYSYTLLALKLEIAAFNFNFAKKHISLFHIFELKEIARLVGSFSGVYLVLSEFKEESLKSLVVGAGSILSKNYFLIRNNNNSSSDRIFYNIFLRSEVEDFLKNKDYRLNDFSQNKNCALREGSICWTPSLKRFSLWVSQSSFYFFIFSLLVIVLVLLIILSRIKRDKKEDEQKKLSLRILAHELRTPISSLMLITERFKEKFDDLQPEVQDLSLKLNDNIYRLKRLTERSQRYLSIDENNLIDYKRDPIESLNDFISSLIDDYENSDISFKALPQGGGAALDVYWFSVCIKNLIDNALAHGIPPIKVELSEENKYFILSVEDKGSLEFSKLSDLTAPFLKSNKSKGMGLGLNIVYKVIEEMGGQLKFTESPTRFSLYLKKGL